MNNFIYLILFLLVLQTHGCYKSMNQTSDTIPELPEINNGFIRGDLKLATSFWYGLGDHHVNILRDMKKDIGDHSDKLIVKKFANKNQHTEKIKQLRQRYMDNIQLLEDLFYDRFTTYGTTGVPLYLSVLQAIDDARHRKSNKKSCDPYIIKWRNTIHSCSWNGLGNTKQIFHYLSDHLEDGFDSYVDASTDTTSDENVLKKMEDATDVTEKFLNEYKINGVAELGTIYTTYHNCLEGILKETKEEGVCT